MHVMIKALKPLQIPQILNKDLTKAKIQKSVMWRVCLWHFGSRKVYENFMPFLDKHKIRLRNHWLQGLQKYINHDRSFKFLLLLLLSASAPLTWICLFTADFKYINQLTSVITLISKECVHKFMKVISKFLDTLHVSYD